MRAGKWVNAHYRTIFLTADAIILLYSLYIHNKYTHELNGIHKKQINILAEKEQHIMSESERLKKILSDPDFREYLELRGKK